MKDTEPSAARAGETCGGTKGARGSIWRLRARRFTTGANVCVSLVLAALLAAMVNYLSSRYYLRRDLSTRGYYALSEKTTQLIKSLEADVHVMAFFQKRHELFDDVRNLLREYQYAAAGAKPQRLTVELVDPDRDLAQARELKRKYDLHAANVVVFETGTRRKYVEAKDLGDYDYTLSSERSFEKKRASFRGEQVFSSAVQSVVQSATPVIYFLKGHGERDTDDFSKRGGYSTIARMVRRDNMSVKPLLLVEDNAVPEDCCALVVAGPDRKLAMAEVDLLADYLNRNGRMLVLMDPAVRTGLEPLLGAWGVTLQADVVVDPRRTLTGRELFVTAYGSHPITRNLKKVTAMFYMPRSVNCSSGSSEDARADRPRATVLASSTKNGWAETDLNQTPARFDAETDRRGPIPVAVAVEKGPVSGIEVEIKPTRLVVLGDSFFVSNGALKSGGGGNVDFFLSALNWLVEREALMAIGPKIPEVLSLDMTRQEMLRVYLIVVGAVPAVAAFAGLFVWLRRRT